MREIDATGFVSAEARLVAIVQSSDDAIYSKDRDARVRSWNTAAERLYGYNESEAIGQHVSFIVPPEQRGEEIAILERILRDERVDHYETVRVRKDGGRVHVSLTVSPLYDEDGEIVGASVVARDISDRRRQEELEEQLARLEFVNVVAHELKSPLSTITRAVEMLNAYSDDLSGDMRDLLDIVFRQSANAQRLISDLLDLSRMQSGRFEVVATDVDVGEVIRLATEAVPMPEGRTLEVRVPKGLRASADQGRLLQVVSNLLSNALKYGGDHVAVEAFEHGSGVEIVVADDGVGLPEGFEEAAFTPFARAPGVMQQGSGLGLTITKGLVEAQGGSIRYERGKSGARFVVTLRAAS